VRQLQSDRISVGAPLPSRWLTCKKGNARGDAIRRGCGKLI
jgi:hypothetical protein